jgi:hypothetical protein
MIHRRSHPAGRFDPSLRTDGDLAHCGRDVPVLCLGRCQQEGGNVRAPPPLLLLFAGAVSASAAAEAANERTCAVDNTTGTPGRRRFPPKHDPLTT